MNESDKGAVSDDKKQIKTVRKIYPQIYSFTLPAGKKLATPNDTMLMTESGKKFRLLR